MCVCVCVCDVCALYVWCVCAYVCMCMCVYAEIASFFQADAGCLHVRMHENDWCGYQSLNDSWTAFILASWLGGFIQTLTLCVCVKRYTPGRGKIVLRNIIRIT